MYSYDLIPISGDTVYKESVAYELQSNIATWYRALRMVAIVGLLSVLVYLGIRIILSSTSAQDKAKYKSMIKDWLVAICLLFVLHYIMTFMLTLTDDIIGLIKDNVIKQGTDTDAYDDLISVVRNNYSDLAEAGDLPWETAGYTVMYLALVILTGIFTIQYLKRVVFMAFLTMISPLIALTYPLDKVKDGKAQAFNYWLKEYIFNCLIQPVHLLLYVVFINNAIDFATKNVLYSIVTLAFMVPAEKIIKEMFGLKSSSPSSTLGAAAGGAFMMSMLNKIKAKPQKGEEDAEAGGGKASNGVRTASRSPIVQNNNNQNNNNQNNNNQNNNNQNNNSQNNSQNDNSQNNNSQNNSNGSNYSIARGLGAITGVNKLISAPGKTFNNGMKGATRKTAGVALGALAGTAMLANEVADGHLFEDPSGALSKVGGATVAGYAGGNALAGNAMGKIESGVTTFQKGAMGAEAYSNRQFDKKFYSSEDYKKITQDSSIVNAWGKDNIREVAQTFLDNGVTDSSIIKTAMQNGINGDEYKAISSLGVTDVKNYKSVRDKNKGKSLNASQIAARMQIAKNLPTNLYNDKYGFIRYAKRFGIEAADAEKLFSQIDDFV